MTALQLLRESLMNARSSGLREVRDSNGETISYKSDAEMAAAIRALDSEIYAQQRGGRPSTILCSTSKGL